ncbi:hypothetical protein BS17DRAFT_701538 [Gyrodon lividus]|nr:hypothetical protein BS17DRAFT_701538 [Gyrodon lividus]
MGQRLVRPEAESPPLLLIAALSLAIVPHVLIPDTFSASDLTSDTLPASTGVGDAYPVDKCRAALERCPKDDPLRDKALFNLAISLSRRFDNQETMPDLEESIALHRASLVLRPARHPRRHSSLNKLADCLHDLFKQTGMTADLNEAIYLNMAALELSPSGHTQRFLSFGNLAICLRTCFNEQGIITDLGEAIRLQKEALDQCSLRHRQRIFVLSNLASPLRTRFDVQGNMTDLEEAIDHHKEALTLRPLEAQNNFHHSTRTWSLGSLANGLQVRFEHQGRMADLDEAIELHRGLQRRVLILRPLGHPKRSSTLGNLATCLSIRFGRLHIVVDLDEAIAFYRAALELYVSAHHERPASLNNLASALLIRFEQQGVMTDLEVAIELHRSSLLLRLLGNSEWTSSLHGLANNLLARFQRQGTITDLNEATELYGNTLSLLPEGHPHQSLRLCHLANGFKSRFAQQADIVDREVLRIYSTLADVVPHAPSGADLRAAKGRIDYTEELNHTQSILAYRTMLRVLVRYINALPSSPQYFEVVKSATLSIAMDAFSCCIRHDDLTAAVQLLEQGRAVFWTQLLQLRHHWRRSPPLAMKEKPWQMNSSASLLSFATVPMRLLSRNQTCSDV